MSRGDLIITDISHLKGEPFTRIRNHSAGLELLNELLPHTTSFGVESRLATRLLFAQHLESRTLSERRDSWGAAGYPSLRSAVEDPRIQTGNTLSTPGNNNSTQFTLHWPVYKAFQGMWNQTVWPATSQQVKWNTSNVDVIIWDWKINGEACLSFFHEIWFFFFFSCFDNESVLTWRGELVPTRETLWCTCDCTWTTTRDWCRS